MRPAPLSLGLDPGMIGILLVTLLAVLAARRAAGKHHRPTRGRLWFLVGAAALVIAYISPLAPLARYYLLTAHLAQVTLVMAVAAPFLLLSLPAQTARGLPRALRIPITVLTQPVLAVVAMTVGFFAWHYAPAFDAALHNTVLYDLEQATYLVTALMLWWPIVQPYSSSQRPRMSPMGRLGYILVATLPQTFGGITVALVGHVIYMGYGSGPSAVGWNALVDQQIAGSCIALLNKGALFTAFMIVILRLLRTDDSTGNDDDGGLHRIPPERPLPGSPPAPEWLADVEANRTVPEPTPRPRGIPAPAGSRERERVPSGHAT